MGTSNAPKASDYQGQSISHAVPMTAPTRFQLAPTPPDILGPFYLPNAPFRTQIVPFEKTTLPSLILSGKVLDMNGALLHGVLIEVWQADENGVYDNNPIGPMKFRGNQRTGQLGEYLVETIIPGDYKISDPGQPDDFRCSHIHFKLTCPGYKELITQLYFPNDKYNATDHWFDARRVIQPPIATFNFVLEPSS